MADALGHFILASLQPLNRVDRHRPETPGHRLRVIIPVPEGDHPHDSAILVFLLSAVATLSAQALGEQLQPGFIKQGQQAIDASAKVG